VSGDARKGESSVHGTPTRVVRPLEHIRMTCPVCLRETALLYLVHAPCHDIVECQHAACGAVTVDPPELCQTVPF